MLASFGTMLAPVFLAVALLALIIALLHQGQTRRIVRVPSLILWRQLQSAQGKTHLRARWPRRNLPMLLQMLAVALLALALARPLLGEEAAMPRHVIYVLDASGSMNGRDGKASRFDLAREDLAALLAGSRDPDGPRVSLIAAGPAPRLLVARQTNDRDILAAIAADLFASNGMTDWNAVARLIAQTRRQGEREQLVILSDGSDPQMARLGDLALPMREIRIGNAITNATLEARLVAVADSPARLQLTGKVRFSGGHGPATVSAEFQSPGSQLPLRVGTATIAAPAAAAGSESSFSIDLAAIGAGLLTARLDDDANLSDNAVRFVIGARPSPTSILLVGNPRPALRQALQALEGSVLTETEQLPADASAYDLVVVSDVAVARPPETNTLWVGEGRLGSEPRPPALAPGSATSWRNDHPLSRGIVWSGLALSRAAQIAAWPDAETVLGAGDTALITARSTAHGREVRIAFDPSREWSAETSFPQFLDNLIAWSGLVRGGRVATPCMVGAACAIDARWYGRRLVPLLSGAGAEAIQLPSPGGVFLPERSGVFKLEGGGEGAMLAINANSRERMDPPATAPAVAAAAGPFALWPWLVALAGWVLALEAYVSYRRREAPRWLLPARLGGIALLLAAFFNLPAPRLEAADPVAIVAGSADPSREPGAGVIGGAAALAVDSDIRIVADRGGPGAGKDTSASPGTPKEAIRLAAAMLPAGQPGRVVIAGDLPLSLTEVKSLADELRRRGVTVDALPPKAMPAGEVAMAGLEAPPGVFAGDSFALTGRVLAGGPTTGHVRVTRAGDVLAEQDVTLAAGENPVEIIVPKAGDGDALYEISITAPGDIMAGNNVNGSWVQARPAPRILVVGLGEAASNLADGLAAHGFAPKLVVPTGAPWLIEDWLAYDAFVFLDVSAIALNTTQQLLVADAVAQHGRPLLLLGGPHSFGPGGYLETVLDRLSPLSSRVPKPSPEAAVVFVIDRSGSMAQSVGTVDRLEIAKQATLSAIGLLNPQSQIGIVAFDTEAHLFAPLQSVSRIASIRSALAQMSPGGGTHLLPALELAEEQLRGAASSIKHVIVLTDGLTQPADFEPILQQLRASGISVSMVAIGVSPDALMRNIARSTGGAFHATSDFKALPSILSQETMLLSDSAVEERTATPVWTATARPPFLAGLPNDMPAIDGYVLTTPKPEATIHLNAPNADGGDTPILASWRFGSGRVLALTTQAIGPWTRRWPDLPGYADLWPNVLRHLLTGAEPAGLSLRLARADDRLTIAVTALDKGRRPRPGLSLTASVTHDRVQPMALPLIETRSGTYLAEMPAGAVGDYRVEVVDGASRQVATLHVGIPRRLEFDPELMAGSGRLAAATGGKLLATTASLNAPASSWVLAPFWIFWALAGLAAFMCELLARYGFSPSALASRWRRQASPAPRTA